MQFLQILAFLSHGHFVTMYSYFLATIVPIIRVRCAISFSTLNNHYCRIRESMSLCSLEHFLLTVTLVAFNLMSSMLYVRPPRLCRSFIPIPFLFVQFSAFLQWHFFGFTSTHTSTRVYIRMVTLCTIFLELDMKCSFLWFCSRSRRHIHNSSFEYLFLLFIKILRKKFKEMKRLFSSSWKFTVQWRMKI